MKNILILTIVWLCGISLFAQRHALQLLRADRTTVYVVRLTGGDMLSGTIARVISQKKSTQEPEDGIILVTHMGELTIYASEIAEITPREALYRHNHRMFFMPTAQAVGKNHFAGLLELLGLYAGVGVGDIFSCTAVRTVVPGISAAEQISHLNLKASVYSMDLDESGKTATFALGSTITWLNAPNQMINLYGVTTFASSRTTLTAMVFTKLGGEDVYTFRARDWFTSSIPYKSGVIGLGAGLDSRLSDHHNLHIIAELWTTNIARLSDTMAMVGLRLCNTTVAMDAGLAIFPALPSFLPIFSLAPVVSFVWTPF